MKSALFPYSYSLSLIMMYLLSDEYKFNLIEEDESASLSGKIIECSWDSEDGSWTCMRIRTDKSTPNDINTYRKVINDMFPLSMLRNNLLKKLANTDFSTCR